MTVLALVLAIAAIVCFCLAAGRTEPAVVVGIPVGLALLTAAWIVQLLNITHRLHVH